jgi:16S rRNA (guanine966-N2)-methyltransferase
MRITGGEYRSRPLKAPNGTATRPTSDRVREALFSMLGARGALRGGEDGDEDDDGGRGARVLDLYAGTGALGLEALSRGASAVVFVERSREALAALQANVAALGVQGRVKVVAGAVERAGRALALADGPFDLVFADPPYADVKSGVAVRAILALAVPRMTAGGLLVLEHASRDPAPGIDGLTGGEGRAYGDTTVTFYERRAF